MRCIADPIARGEQNVVSHSAGAPRSETILTVQVLRGIAAMLVVYAHAIDFQQRYVPGYSYQSGFHHLENFGTVGVDLFFVVSGIVMAIAAPGFSGPRAASRFAAKRLLRIVPIYWLLTAATAAVLMLGLGVPIEMPRLATSFSFVPLFWHGQYIFPIIVLGWSLSFELYFYLLITAALLFGRASRAVPIVVGALTVFIAIGLIAQPRGNLAAVALNPICFEFVLGCCIGSIYRLRGRDLPASLAAALFACGLLFLLATMLFGYGDIDNAANILTGESSMHRLLLWGFPSALLVAGLVFSERRLKALIPGSLLLIGNASYSIYLTEIISLGQFGRLCRRFELHNPDTAILAGTISAILFGIVFYQVVERPLTRWLNRFAFRPVARERASRIGVPPSPMQCFNGDLSTAAE